MSCLFLVSSRQAVLVVQPGIWHLAGRLCSDCSHWQLAGILWLCLLLACFTAAIHAAAQQLSPACPGHAAANRRWVGLPCSPLASHPEVSSDRAPPAAVSASTTQVFPMAAASLERWQTGNAQSWQCSSSCAARLTTERNLTCAGVARGRAGAPQQAQVGVGLSPAGHDTAEGL